MTMNVEKDLIEIRDGIRELSRSLGSIQIKISELDVNRNHQVQNSDKLEARVKELELNLRTIENRITWFTGAVAVVSSLLIQILSWLMKTVA